MNRIRIPRNEQLILNAAKLSALIGRSQAEDREALLATTSTPGILGYAEERTANLAPAETANTNVTINQAPYVLATTQRGTYRLYRRGDVSAETSFPWQEDEYLLDYLATRHWPYTSSDRVTIAAGGFDAVSTPQKSIRVTTMAVTSGAARATFNLTQYTAIRSDATLRIVMPVQATGAVTVTLDHVGYRQYSVAGSIGPLIEGWRLLTADIPLDTRIRRGDAATLSVAITSGTGIPRLRPWIYEAWKDLQCAAFLLPGGAVLLHVDEGVVLLGDGTLIAHERTAFPVDLSAASLDIYLAVVEELHAGRAIATGARTEDTYYVRRTQRARVTPLSQPISLAHLLLFTLERT
jgi:hypothetical protein